MSSAPDNVGAVRAPTAPGWPARRSPTTCCAPRARSPAATTPWPAAPPCAATWSTCPPASPPRPQTDPAPARPLALANRMENPVGQRHRLLLPDRPTPRRLTHRPVPVHPPSQARPEEPQRKRARPQRRPILHLPTHWPWSKAWLALWHNTIGRSPPIPATTRPTRQIGPTGQKQEKLDRPALTPCTQPNDQDRPTSQPLTHPRRWIEG